MKNVLVSNRIEGKELSSSVWNLEQALSYLSSNRFTEYGFDTETTGFDPHSDKLLAYQLCGDRETALVFDAQSYPIECVKSILENNLLIIHNAQFDLRFLYKNNILPKEVFDTFLAEKVNFNGFRGMSKSLKGCLLRYFNISLKKENRGLIHREGFSDRVIEYCAEDVLFIQDLKDKQHQIALTRGTEKTIALENRFVKVVAYMALFGIRPDIPRWTTKCEEDLREKESIISNMSGYLDLYNLWPVDTQLSLFGFDKSELNWNSDKEVYPIFEKLGFHPSIVGDDGNLKPSLAASALKDIDHPMADLYAAYSKANKLCGTYGYNFLDIVNPVTGRIHTQFNQILSSGRISSGKNAEEKEQSFDDSQDDVTSDVTNLQNIPSDKRHRSCIIPGEGNIFVISDYSQQEQVILANFSKDPAYLKFFTEGLGDMHKLNSACKIG